MSKPFIALFFAFLLLLLGNIINFHTIEIQRKTIKIYSRIAENDNKAHLECIGSLQKAQRDQDDIAKKVDALAILTKKVKRQAYECVKARNSFLIKNNQSWGNLEIKP